MLAVLDDGSGEMILELLVFVFLFVCLSTGSVHIVSTPICYVGVLTYEQGPHVVESVLRNLWQERCHRLASQHLRTLPDCGM